MSKNKYPRKDERPSESGATPDDIPAAPASKEEIATDVSEVARARLSDTDKTQTGGSVAKDAAEAAPGVAGTPADDDTAAKVEAAPTAVQSQDSPGPKARGEQGPDAPTPTPPAAAAAAPDPATTTGGGSEGAPLASNPAGTGAATRQPETTAEAATPAQPATTTAAPGATAGPSPDAPPATPGNGAARAADPDTTASAPTAPDAPPTSAAAAAATVEAEKKPDAPATPARPAAAAGAGPAPASATDGAKPAPAAPADGARPAPAARPAAAGAGARPAAAGRPGAKPGAAAAPPKPPEPDPDEVKELRQLVPDLTWERRHGYLEVRVPSAQLVPVARAVRGLGYDYLSAVTAVDWRDRVEMLYHCYGWDYVNVPGCVVIRADLPPEPNPLCPSLTTVWVGAELQEREIYDLFGVKFVGHPDLRRILLEDTFPGHPLRKDWTFDYQYVLVKHLKYGAEGQDAPPGGEEGFRRV